MQDLLEQVADSTKWSDEPSKQKEFGAWIVETPAHDTTLVFWTVPSSLPRNQCLSGYDQTQYDALIRAGNWILADVHSHPKGELIQGPPNQIIRSFKARRGVSCLGGRQDATGNYVPLPFDKQPSNGQPGEWWMKPGPSQYDRSWWTAQDAPSYPAYVLEFDHLYRIDQQHSGIITRPMQAFDIKPCVGHQTS